MSFDSTGIEFAMTSLFVIIFTEQWENAENHIPALIGILCTVACLLVFGSESFLIPSMICISMALLVMRRFGSDNAKGGDVK